jgi:rhamnosyltransferase
MNEPLVSIIVRSFNEGWALGETLAAIKQQDYRNWELIVIDSGSSDGSQELIRAAQPAHFIQIQPHEYNPSRVINLGMRLGRSEFGIFLNADATPQGSAWLRPLVTALRDGSVAAVFGRQIARPDCRAVYACDYDRCFGPNRESAQWDHFFSMVSSGLRKDIWSKRGFLEKLQYAEDDEYTRWAKTNNYKVIYCPESVVMHSHNYTAAQAYKRSFGDAKALAASWRDSPDEFDFVRTCLLGWLSDIRHDLRFCLHEHRLSELAHCARIRWEQRRGKLSGFREGWRIYRELQNEDIGTDKSLSPALSRGI